jgi:hypothetical protein
MESEMIRTGLFSHSQTDGSLEQFTDRGPLTPTHTSRSAENACPVCQKSLSWFNRKRHCTLCGAVTCRECASKKAMPGQVACLKCLEHRQLEREVTTESAAVVSNDGTEPGSPHTIQAHIPKGYFGLLRIHIEEARGLVAADSNILGQRTSSDPYCVITLSTDRTRRTTKVVSSTLNPFWNSDFDLPVRVPVQNLEITVFDKDVTGTDDNIGKVVIPIDQLPNGQPLTGWLPIFHSKENDAISQLTGQVTSIPAGAIRVSVRLDYKASAELRYYVRGAVFVPPPVAPKFDVNALYGPGMLTLELLWTRSLQPLVNLLVYLIQWENFIASAVVTLLLIPIALNLHL